MPLGRDKGKAALCTMEEGIHTTGSASRNAVMLNLARTLTQAPLSSAGQRQAQHRGLKELVPLSATPVPAWAS